MEEGEIKMSGVHRKDVLSRDSLWSFDLTALFVIFFFFEFLIDKEYSVEFSSISYAMTVWYYYE